MTPQVSYTPLVPLTLNGRFFGNNDEPFFVKAITYGPFPPAKELDPAQEFARIAKAGFNTIRLYESPSRQILDLAAQHKLLIIPTIPWHWDSLFLENPNTLQEAKNALSSFLRKNGEHPALGALLIANEIRPDLVRFMGPLMVREALEELILFSKELCPNLPVAYANFPTTEYLEPRNADFTAFNVYLEDPDKYRDYLRRLHNIAGDRPLLLTEFGFQTFSKTGETPSDPELESKQVDILQWAYRISQEENTAGFTLYAWSDLWFNGGKEITDWSFGLNRRDGSPKPALQALFEGDKLSCEQETPPPLITIAICTRNGSERLRSNLPTFETIADSNFELLIVDDGSTDSTKKTVEAFIQKTSLPCRLLSQEPSGLSVARNHAAREGKGEFIVYIDDDARHQPQWISAIREAFARNPKAAAAGGPNLAPTPISRQNAIVTACLGNASHILFTDTTAEHLPGCNFALRRDVLLQLGGFDPTFHAAGDDVDVCWRLLDKGYQLAFHPTACVSHDRRATIKGFLRQQRGYGEAEALLYHKHPNRFGPAGIRWEGFIYSGSPLTVDFGTVIYHGPMGSAPFQMLHSTHMPIRPLARDYNTPLNRLLVKATEKLASYLRRKTRKNFRGPSAKFHLSPLDPDRTRQTTRRDYPSANFNARQDALDLLREQGWRVSLQEEIADLDLGPLQLILAQTPVPNEGVVLHLKFIHPPMDVSDTLANLEQTIKQSTS